MVMPHVTKGSVFKERSSGAKFRFAGFTGRDKTVAVVEVIGETMKSGAPKTMKIKFDKLKNGAVYKMVKRADPGDTKAAKPRKVKAEKVKKFKKVKAAKPAKVKKFKVKKAKVAKPAKVTEPAAVVDVATPVATSVAAPTAGKVAKVTVGAHKDDDEDDVVESDSAAGPKGNDEEE